MTKKKLERSNTLKGQSGGVNIVTHKEVMEKKGLVQSIPIADINPPKYHDRKSYTQEDVVELAKNIEASGGRLLQPIVLRKVGEKLERIIGFMRMEAYKYMGRKEIEAIVLRDVSDEEAILYMLSENIQRKDPNIYDQTVSILEYIGVALGAEVDEVKKLLYHFRNIDSKTIKETSDDMMAKRELMETITNKLGKISVSTLINRLKIFSLNTNILDALKSGDISYGAAVEINKAKEDEKIKRYIELIKNGEISIKEVQEQIRRAKDHAKKPHSPLPYNISNKEGSTVLSLDQELSETQLKKLEKFLSTL